MRRLLSVGVSGLLAGAVVLAAPAPAALAYCGSLCTPAGAVAAGEAAGTLSHTAATAYLSGQAIQLTGMATGTAAAAAGTGVSVASGAFSTGAVLALGGLSALAINKSAALLWSDVVPDPPPGDAVFQYGSPASPLSGDLPYRPYTEVQDRSLKVLTVTNGNPSLALPFKGDTNVPGLGMLVVQVQVANANVNDGQGTESVVFGVKCLDGSVAQTRGTSIPYNASNSSVVQLNGFNTSTLCAPATGGLSHMYLATNYPGSLTQLWSQDFPTRTGPVQRTVQTTVTCQRPNGTTHTITSTYAISDSASFAETAGLMCPYSQRARDAKVDVQSTRGAGTNTTTIVEVLPEPWFENIPQPCWWGNCVLTEDPNTGEPKAEPATQPTPTPTPTPTGTVNPTPTPTGTTPANPGPTYVPEPDPIPENQTGEDFCSYSLGDFVTGMVIFKAVGCALMWAFVPSPAVMEGTVTQVRDAWADTAPGQIAAKVGEVQAVAPANPGSSCLGPEVNVPTIGLVEVYPFANCDPPASTVAGVWLPIFSVVTWVGALYVAARLILSTIGAPGPPGGGSDGD